MKKYDLASPGKAPDTLKLLLDVSEIDDQKSRFLFYENESCLLIYNSDYGSDPMKVVADQIEIPLPALAWLKDTIENGFRKPVSAGGFSNTKHGASGTFDGEEVLIVRAMYAGTDKPGFNIVNKSRLSHILAICPQSISFTDEFVDQYFLPLLEKQISKGPA